MREIKFRYVLKNKHTKKIHYKWYYISQIELGLNKLFNVDDYEIISRDQKIGREDKKGSEIYEGDRVRILYTGLPSKIDNSEMSLDEYKKSISSYGVVVWRNTYWCIKMESDKYVNYYNVINPGRHGEIEVIGNIHKGIKEGGNDEK